MALDFTPSAEDFAFQLKGRTFDFYFDSTKAPRC